MRYRKQIGTLLPRLKNPRVPEEETADTEESRSHRGLQATLRIWDFIPTLMGDLHAPPEESS